MANKDITNPVDINNSSNTRRTADLLPGYHRSDKNQKFLSSTLDQFIQQPQLERINGFVGSKLSLNYNPSKDNYISGGSKLRDDYQLEPSLVVRDVNKNIFHASSYDDLINQMAFNGANVSNLDRLFRPKSYSYDPCIDWDKFVNFRQYYWLPTGPDRIEISGQQKTTVSTYTVTDSADGNSLIFTPDGLTTTPLLTLYRGATYVFNVTSKYPFYIKTAYVPGAQSLYSGVTNQGVKQGQLILTIDDFTPNTLFYFAEGNDNAIGQIVVKQQEENTALDIEADILGKETYKSQSGLQFSNGMKIRFVGQVTPEYYKDKDFIVEGVGDAIKLIDFNDLQTVGLAETNVNVNFDGTLFDEYPFDDFTSVPLTPEYITINRAAPDLNSWARYNRWVHADVISATAAANNVPVVYPMSMQAKRPIIEFNAGLQLYNFGAFAKKNVDLIDNTTKRAFATFEGSAGFYIDGVEVEQGYRVIFNADNDPLVRGRIYEVKFVNINERTVVNLEEVSDTEPLLNESVVTIRGNENAGANWWYNGDKWIFAQQKTELNQPPLFDLYDDNGNRFADQTFYNSSFKGTTIFNYAVGTGTPDPVLGFPLKYRNVVNVGDYLFENSFMTDTFTIFENSNVISMKVSGNYLKVNSLKGETFRDVWVEQVEMPIPIIQFQVIEQESIFVQITAINNPGYTNDLQVSVFVNDVKLTRNVDYTIARDGPRAFVVTTSKFNKDDRVLIEIFTQSTPTETGYYEVPSNLTNNPLNGSVPDFTFTEVSDHAKTIVYSSPEFSGIFPGVGNLRDLPSSSKYGSRIVSHKNPLSFAHYFMGTKEHNLIDAIRKVSLDYNQFKLSLINQVSSLRGLYTPREALDNALEALNANKDKSFPYDYSDMLPYGQNQITRTYTVTNSRNVRYSLASVFDCTVLSERALLVYLNGKLLAKDQDYTIEQYNPSIIIHTSLAKGDVIEIVDYPSTAGCYVPPTPTKLGLYPKFVPSIYVDDTYAKASGPQRVIQGHDGSITIAFTSVEEFERGEIDYRDEVLLEFETRIYNNIKASYNPDLMDIHSILPGAFRNNEYSLNEITQLLTADFLRWAGFFGVDYKTNNSFDEADTLTFNYSSNIDSLNKNKLPGHWRAVYKYFYDTDRPHTHPWEMLGFSDKPTWWNSVYGPAPYTSGNLILWQDLEEGRIAQTGTINPLYARPGLSKIIPVDGSGNLLSPTDTGLATTPIIDINDPNRIVVLRSDEISAEWEFGDQGPAETAWRHSSYWPFACQILMALSKPADYAALMFDTSRLKTNAFGQYRYGDLDEFLRLPKVSLYRDVINDNRVLASGYSVFVIESGFVRDVNYLSKLKADLGNIDYNLMAKLGGFASKDKLQVKIDAVDPSSPYPGVLIPSEDYEIFFNQSSPIESLGISGLIVQKTGRGWAVRGYDRSKPYFTIFAPFQSNQDQIERVGGRSESFVNWSQNTTYNEGQIIFYQERYYRVKQKHNSDLTFNTTYYQSLPYLPTTGGVGVFRRTSFDTSETIVPYGTEFVNIQDVYDLIIGYGKWLESKGFKFQEFNTDLNQILDWNFTAREYLYWTTQNWAVNSVITLSPFANKLEYFSDHGTVDSIANNFYEYSLLKADGAPFPRDKFSISRLDGTFSINTINTQEGLFFARINVIQKEHAVIFNNYTLFNDVVYSVETGYRQRRVNLSGFRTANWNGDFFSPGFVFDQAIIKDWQKFTDYGIGDVVRFSGKYYAAPVTLPGTASFNLDQWVLLGDKPTPNLMPNFDYKIGQFEDFYSLDIDNFDAGQQKMAQHLTGYTPRPYLNSIIGDPIAQYKFYQGYIREKGTKNPLSKLSKSSLNNFQSSIDFNEEWAFRIGYYGGYNTYQEFETLLDSTQFVENPQIIEFVPSVPQDATNTVYYKDINDIIIKPENFEITQVFPAAPTTSLEEKFQLPVAGYVRFDDIKATAYNKNSILDIANNKSLQEGDTIWLGFKENGDWDVLRYTQVPTVVTNVAIDLPGQTVLFTTNYPHQLATNDLVSISRVGTDIDQCYIVAEVVSPTSFTVYSSLFEIPTLPEPITGLLFVFRSSRLKSFEDLYTVPFLEKWNYGEKLWIDDNGSGNWTVYEKINNYSSTIYNNGIQNASQHFGAKVVASNNTSTFIASAPDYNNIAEGTLGRIFVLSRTSGDPVINFGYSVNDDNAYFLGTNTNAFGTSLVFDDIRRIVIAGAPLASNVKASNTNTVVDPELLANSNENQGVVKVSLLTSTLIGEQDKLVITTPNPEENAEFGASLVYSTITDTLLVGSPGYNNGTGAVYKYTVSASTTSVSVNYVEPIYGTVPGTGFGKDVAADNAGTRIAISAPLYDITNGIYAPGAIYIFDPALAVPQIITSSNPDLPYPFSAFDKFGSVVRMTNDGKYLFVGSPLAFDEARGEQTGVVDVFKWNNISNEFTHNQRIHSPVTSANVSFGFDIAINDDGLVVISSVGNAKTQVPTFDTYFERLDQDTALSTYGSIYINDATSTPRRRATSFDSGSTSFYEDIKNAGSAHAYYLYGDKWAHSQELINPDIASGSFYGTSLSVTNNEVFIGAPASYDEFRNGNGQIFIYNKIDSDLFGWNVLREESTLVDISQIGRAVTIDTTTEQIQDYIDIIDPIKGSIIGTAREELKFITPYDPAIYSVGIDGVNVNVNSNWLDDHVGELWWDLATVKYVWYEQGELEYRRNNWNSIFPGCSIDVYEWVGTPYLPSEWSALADTTDGLARGISGQPRFVDNSVISVKQVYNSVSNAFTNVYYYWVKNKTIVPANVRNRKKSAFEVAKEIADPIGSGKKFLSVLSPTAMMLANSKTDIATNDISLNIAFDYITNAANRHTEWLLLQENDPNSRPNMLLEKKLIDSLLGRDSIGNSVPDPTLPAKLRYGVEIRPRQSLFVNRGEALRNIIEFVNNVISTQLLTGRIDFSNLNAKEELPLPSTYDVLVEDVFALDLLPTVLLDTPRLTAILDDNGRIADVLIDSPGYGYLTPPTVSIFGDGTGAKVSVIIDPQGRVVDTVVDNPGSGYTAVPELVVRPFTAIVQTDKTIGGKWSQCVWDKTFSAWNRIKTQVYDTTLYWKYIDWQSADYDQLANISVTVPSTYALNAVLTYPQGSYVKVSNGGDGRFIVVRRTDGTGGSFDSNWDIVYAEHGTIQFLDTVWTQANSFYAFDEFAGFDQTQFDQAPDQELAFILSAIKDDMFVNDLKIYWNQLFFKAVRYALTEQKNLDWAFKTAFISVVNNLGSLDQRATYKLQNSKNYEDFLKEIKPYHTKIRKFTEEYTGTEYSQTYTTDFDLPAFYNTSTFNFNKVEFGNELLLQYPWKSWYQNYTYEIEAINVSDPGSNYTEAPTVTIIPAFGDNGHGATAKAFISLGKVSRVEVTNPGTGYTSAPTVVFNGGLGTASTVAKAYARLGNNKVRVNNITMKFDRVSGNREVGSKYFTDTFISNGEKVDYDLTWVPVADKTDILLTVNGVLQMLDSFTIEYSVKPYSPQTNTSYKKKYAKLKLQFIPNNLDKIEITYPKDLGYYKAVDRIEDYYEPTPGMPGRDPDQLMAGLSYAGLQVDTLPFDSAGGWDVVPYGVSTWDNYSVEGGYVSFSTTSTDTQTFVLSDTLFNTGTMVNVYINNTRIDSTLPNAIVPSLYGAGTGAVDYILVQAPGAGYTGTFVTVTISAPNNINGIQATATATVVNGAITEITINNPGKGYTENPVVTITGESTVQAYAKAVLKAEFTTATSTATFTDVVIPASTLTFTSTQSLVVFRYATSDGTLQLDDLDILDAVISGGDLAYTTALGLTPTEIILDGGSTSTQHITGMNDDGFLNPINSYAPEECVPGQIQEALGISVYTSPFNTTPIISTKRYWADGSTSTYSLGITPTSEESVLVTLDNQKISSNVYNIDYENNTVTFDIDIGTGWLALTSMQLGSIGLIGAYRELVTTTGTSFLSSAAFDDIGSNGTSTYVTFNGIAGVQGVDYTVTNENSRAKITFNQTGTVQAFLFNAPVKAFSEIKEQVISATTSTKIYPLIDPPGTLAPYHSQVIVTKNGMRLNPPVTTYYAVTSEDQLEFDISQSIVFPPRSITVNKIEVYINGVPTPKLGVWRYTQRDNKIRFSLDAITVGDVIAIVVKKDNDYLIENNSLVLTETPNAADVLSVTTFTNHNPDFIRTERFNGHATNEYRISRPALDSAYVWVAYNGLPLVNDVDYKVSVDGFVVTIREGLYRSPDDDIVITSFAGLENRLIAYRIFKDLLGRTHYKRLSADNTTELVEPLYTTSTSIVVADSSVLTVPDVLRNRPGIVLIDGERIEFFTINGNELGQLRRSTLGTAPKAVYPVGTSVIDQGVAQTVPFTENLTIYKFTSTDALSYPASNIALIPDANSWDQVEVKLGGRKLLKTGLYTVTHNNELGYDSSPVTDTRVLPEFIFEDKKTVFYNTTTQEVTATVIVTSSTVATYSTVTMVPVITTSTEIVTTATTLTNVVVTTSTEVLYSYDIVTNKTTVYSTTTVYTTETQYRTELQTRLVTNYITATVYTSGFTTTNKIVYRTEYYTTNTIRTLEIPEYQTVELDQGELVTFEQLVGPELPNRNINATTCIPLDENDVPARELHKVKRFRFKSLNTFTFVSTVSNVVVPSYPTHLKLRRTDGVNAVYKINNLIDLLRKGSIISKDIEIDVEVDYIWANDPGGQPLPESTSVIKHEEIFRPANGDTNVITQANPMVFSFGKLFTTTMVINTVTISETVLTSATVAELVPVITPILIPSVVQVPVTTSTNFYVTTSTDVVTSATVTTSTIIYTTSTVMNTSTVEVTTVSYNTETVYTTSTMIIETTTYQTVTNFVSVVEFSTATTTTTILVDVTTSTEVVTPVLTLNTTVTPGLDIEVIQRKSSIWYNPDSEITLGGNNTAPAKFLLERSAALPDKYRYE